MTNKVHDTHLMRLVFLDLNFFTKFCQMKRFTTLSNSLHLQRFKLILSGQVCMCYSQMHTLQYTIKLIAVHYFFETYTNAAILV